MAFKDIRDDFRKFPTPQEIGFFVLVIATVIGILSLNISIARSFSGGEWLYQRWSGARGYIFESSEPYSTAVATATQQIARSANGRSVFLNEYRYVLNDPFYIVLLYAPLALFKDFSIARGIWMLFAEAALVASTLFAIRLSEWSPPRWVYAVLIIFSIFSYYSLQSLISASPAIFLLFLYLSILLALQSLNDELAGALLLLVAYQWEVGAIFFLFIMLAVLANQRWGVLTGFVMSLFIMLVVSFLSYSGWGIPYFRAVLSVWYQNSLFNLQHLLEFWLPESRAPIHTILALGLGGLTAIEWVGALHEHFRRIVWVGALSLAVTPLLGFAIFPTNHIVLLLPFILILALVWDRWHKWRTLAVSLVFIPVTAIPFILLNMMPSNNPLYTNLLTLLPPLAAIIGLYWMRWWAVRTPRPWLTQMELRR